MTPPSVAALLACAAALPAGPARGQIPIDLVVGPTIATVSTDAYETSSSVGLFVDGYDCSEYDDFKSTEFGIMGGAALGFPVSEGHNLSFGITYDLGLTDVFSSESDYSYKNRVFYVFVGLGSLIGG